MGKNKIQFPLLHSLSEFLASYNFVLFYKTHITELHVVHRDSLMPISMTNFKAHAYDGVTVSGWHEGKGESVHFLSQYSI